MSLTPLVDFSPSAGFEGTCALTSVANLLSQAGKPTTEGEVVRRATNNAEWRRVA